MLKPVAETYGSAVPLSVQTGVRNAVSNLDVVRKVVNNALQGKPVTASRELARFILNSTVGIAGIFDMASKFGLEPSDQDMGITLGFYGFSHGAYLVLPFLPATTVRDGLGTVADSLLNPLGVVDALLRTLGHPGRRHGQRPRPEHEDLRAVGAQHRPLWGGAKRLFATPAAQTGAGPAPRHLSSSTPEPRTAPHRHGP